MNRFEALKHAVRAHAGTVDKCGRPYILHPIAVAEACERGNGRVDHSQTEYCVVLALLHDVLEDTEYRVPGSSFELKLLNALTRHRGESYADYLDRICSVRWYDVGPLQVPMLVKLADLWHNLQPERMDCLPQKERASLEKRYLKARDRIWETLGHEWWPGPLEGRER